MFRVFSISLLIGLLSLSSSLAQDRDSLLQRGTAMLQSAKISRDSALFASAYLKLGKAHFSVDNERAYSHFQEGLRFLDSTETPLKWAEMIQNLGFASYKRGDYLEALSHYQSAESIYQQLGGVSQKADIQHKLGQTYDRLDISDQAFFHYQKSYDAIISTDKIDSLSLAGLFIDIGSVHSKQSNIPEALAYMKRSVEIFEKINNLTYLPYALNNIGATYIREGNYSQALEYLQKSLRLAEKEGMKRLASSANSNIGGIYISLESYEKALPYLKKSVALAKEIENKAYWASNARKLGTAYEHLGDTAAAMMYYQNSLKIDRETGAKHGIGSAHRSIGELLMDQGKYKFAYFHLEEALNLSKEVGDVKTLSHNYSMLGEWALKQGRWKQAVDHCLNGLSLIEEIQMFRQIKSNCNCLWRAYEKLGNHRAVTIYLKQYMEARDSLFNDEKLQELTRLEMQYQFDVEKEKIALHQEQKDVVIAGQMRRQRLLRNTFLGGLIAGLIILALLWRSYQVKQRTNRQLSEQKDTIQLALDEREVLLKEIHHRVKNNLQVVSSLLGLQSRTIEDPAALDAIEEGRNRVRAMALIHQNLYQEENLVGVHLPDYIEKLTENLMASYRVDQDHIQLTHQIAPISLDVDVLIPLGLILNELISNSLKHAFTDRDTGQIEVQVQKADAGLEVVVQDNGIGLPTDFKPEQVKSMGFKLIRSFISKMGGKLEITSIGGTQIRMVLPKV